MMKIVLLFSVFSIGFGQQLISLSSFKGDNQKNDLPFPAPYSIYVSASSDWESQLGSIYIVNEGGWQNSLLDLVSDKNKLTGENDRYIIRNSSYLTTKLTTDEMKTLTGVMFISSPKQVQDDGFQVFDINYPTFVRLIGNGPLNRTVLFLNTNSDLDPQNSAVISDWKQDSDADSSVSIYPGFPLDSIEPKNTQIFSNPMQTDKSVKKFENVEIFSLKMVAFYMKMYKGIDFTMKAGYRYVDRSRTMYATTTGFYMKPLSFNESLVTINTIKDNRYTGGSTGANILGHLSTGDKVTVAEYGGAYNDQFSTTPNDNFVSWSTSTIGNRFTIASTPRSIGQYYVQYFVDQGQLKQLSDRDEKPIQNQKGQHLPEQFKF